MIKNALTFGRNYDSMNMLGGLWGSLAFCRKGKKSGGVCQLSHGNVLKFEKYWSTDFLTHFWRHDIIGL